MALNAPADLNGDGFFDLVGANGKVSYGSANGQFAAPAAVTVTGLGAANAALPWQTLVADVNGDGRLDMVYAETAIKLVVALGNADGTYTNAAATMGWEVGADLNAQTTGLQLVDLNGDRSLDFVMMGQRRSKPLASSPRRRGPKRSFQRTLG